MVRLKTAPFKFQLIETVFVQRIEKSIQIDYFEDEQFLEIWKSQSKLVPVLHPDDKPVIDFILREKIPEQFVRCSPAVNGQTLNVVQNQIVPALADEYKVPNLFSLLKQLSISLKGESGRSFIVW